ncbi:MAG: manganese efflux pump MntP family protein [Candidatus Omnitrophica bacterium]|nr:manganese efflux pump MntP family protein [Candidatus Omnitrophota bacterium]
MNLLTTILIALSLSMDAFAVSIASGVIIKKQKIKNALKFGLSFGVFQMIMPIVGWLGGRSFVHMIEGIDHWLAFGLLSLVGVKMIMEAGKIDSLERSDSNVSYRVLMILSIATSIDALVVGLSLSFLNVSIIMPVVIIGIITFVMSYAGFFIGNKFGEFFEKKIEIVAGLILIGIGIKILFGHLFA